VLVTLLLLSLQKHLAEDAESRLLTATLEDSGLPLLSGWRRATCRILFATLQVISNISKSRRGQGSVPSRVAGRTIQPSFKSAASSGISGQVDSSWGHGCGQLLGYLYGMAHGVAAGVEMWESGLALYNGRPRWQAHVMSGQDYGDETQTRNSTLIHIAWRRLDVVASWWSSRCWIITHGLNHFGRGEQPQTETFVVSSDEYGRQKLRGMHKSNDS